MGRYVRSGSAELVEPVVMWSSSATIGGAGIVIRVALVDDQELIRAGLRQILTADEGFHVAAEAADGAAAVECVRRGGLDVVVMDVRMRGVDGVEATREIRAMDGPPVLVLTTFDDDEVLWAAIDAGA